MAFVGGRFPAEAPYLAEIVARARALEKRFGGRCDVVDIDRGRTDRATIVVREAPTGLRSAPGLADACEYWYARQFASFIPDSSPGYYWVKAAEVRS